MSLSDYSSDDSFEAEDSQVSQKAVRGLQKDNMSARGTRGGDAGYSTMFLGAMAALAVAGVAAGTLYVRQHFPGRKPAVGDDQVSGHDKKRKDLRRKRGEVKESPRSQPFMARTESASSVGPLRKHPRRDTSEESGGEASGSSPTAGARPKSLRKTASKNRHRRPPLRAPAFEAQKETSEGEATEDTEETKAAPEAVSEVDPVGAEQEGSRATPMPIGVETPRSGTTGEAAEHTAADGATGSHQRDDSQQPAEQAMSSATEPAEVGVEPEEQAPSAGEPAPSLAAAKDRQGAAPSEPSPRTAEDRSFPDLLSESYSASAATQPSLETFTADCDVLDQAVDAVDAEAKLPAQKEAAKGPEEALSKDDGASKESKPQDAEKVDAPQKSADTLSEEKPADSQQDAEALLQVADAKSKDTEPQAAASNAAVAEAKPSAGKPDGGESKDEDSAKQQMPATSAAAGSAKPAESGREPQGEVSEGEAQQKETKLSDEQKAILERGGSLLAEADEVDPKGIQLIRQMQAEVDKQDDMPDFSKTDAYRSSKSRQSEEQARPPADAGDEKGIEAAPSSQQQVSQVALREAKEESAKEQPTMEKEPSLQLLADSTPSGEELDLSSAEVDTVASITRDEPEQAGAQESDVKAGKQAAEQKPEDKGTPQTDAAAPQVGEGAAIGEAVHEEQSQDTQQTDETSTGQPGAETILEHTTHEAEAKSGVAALEAEQLETPPLSDQKHAGEDPDTAPKAGRGGAEKQPEEDSKSEQSPIEAQPAAAHRSGQSHAEKEPEIASEAGQTHAQEHPREAPKSGQSHAGDNPEDRPVTDQSHAQERPKSKAATVELPVQKDPVTEKVEPVVEPSTPAQAPAADALGSSKAEQGSTAKAAQGLEPNGALKSPAVVKHSQEDKQPKSMPAEAAGASEEAPERSASALAGAVAGAAALATEDRDALISSQPSVGTIESSQPALAGSSSALSTDDSKPESAGNSSATNKATESLTEAGKPEAAAAKAPYDPLGMDTPDEAPGSAEVMPSEEGGAEAAEDAAMPRNNTERDVQLNLAVALRMVEERGNVAAAERTLQKQLTAVRESKESIRPDFMQRLVGTLADIIARAAHQEAAAGKHSSSDRMPEIIGLLEAAFESAKAAKDSSRSREGWRLGNAYMSADRLDEAEALFKEEFKYSEDQLGVQNPNTHQTRAYLAEVLVKKGNKAEAYKLLSDASELHEQQAKELSSSKGSESKPDGAAEGEEAPSTLTPQATAIVTAAKCSVKLATMQDDDKDYKDAEASARRAVQLMEGAFGKNNPRNSTAYGTLAAILKHVGGEKELREAIELYTHLQHTMEDIHGLRNAQSALALRSIADVHMMLKEYGEAVQCLEKARQIAAAVHGRDHPILESFWEALAEAKKQAGDKQGAKEASRQALLVKSHAHRPGGGQRSPRETSAPRRGRGRSRR